MRETHTRRKSRGKHHTPPSEGFSLALVKNGAIGLAIGLLVCLSLLLGSSALLLSLPNPHAPLLPVSVGILYISSLSAGFGARQLHGGAPLLCGVVCGGGMVLLFGLVSCFFQKDGESASLFLLLIRLMAVPVACLGGYLSERKSNQAHRRHLAKRRVHGRSFKP